MKVNNEAGYTAILQKAEDFHGHLGPFLVIGIRMGLLGLTQLDPRKGTEMRVVVSVPFRIPFSCVIDGLQIATKCTVGNRKLGITQAHSEIRAEFERRDNGKKFEICLKQGVYERVASQLLQTHRSNEQITELAWEIATISEKELFNHGITL